MSHMTSGPVVALCLQRENAVGRLLEVLGPSDPRAAKKQSQFFLRGSFGEDCIQNGFYGTYMEINICNRMNANLFLSSNIFGKCESFSEISGDARRILGYLNPVRNHPEDLGPALGSKMPPAVMYRCIRSLCFVSRDKC